MACSVDAAQMEAQMLNVPMNRWTGPAEIASVVAWPTQNGSSCRTGANIDVTGGWIV